MRIAATSFCTSTSGRRTSGHEHAAAEAGKRRRRRQTQQQPVPARGAPFCHKGGRRRNCHSWSRGVAAGAPIAGAPRAGSAAGAQLEDEGDREEEPAAKAAPAAARKSAIERRCCVHAFSGRCRSYRSPSNFCDHLRSRRPTIVGCGH